MKRFTVDDRLGKRKKLSISRSKVKGKYFNIIRDEKGRFYAREKATAFKNSIETLQRSGGLQKGVEIIPFLNVKRVRDFRDNPKFKKGYRATAVLEVTNRKGVTGRIAVSSQPISDRRQLDKRIREAIADAYSKLNIIKSIKTKTTDSGAEYLTFEEDDDKDYDEKLGRARQRLLASRGFTFRLKTGVEHFTENKEKAVQY